MATRPPKPHLEDQLRRWVDAGLISADQAAQIRTVETSTVGAASAAEVTQTLGPASLPRPSGIELLAYLGVAVALAGVLTLLYSSATSLTLVGAATAGLGAAALVAMYAFARLGRPAAMRAAGACLGLAAAGLGVGAGELASAAGLFTKTMVIPVDCAFASCPPNMSANQSGNILLGAGVGLAVAIGLIRFVPGQVAALASVIATYTAAASAIGLAGLDRQTSSASIGLILIFASICVAGFGETLRGRQPAVHGFYGFVGVLGSTVPLYVLGGEADTSGLRVPLDVVGGVIASFALAAGIAIPRAGIAYGAVVGLAGLVLDIGIRNFHTSTSIGIFLTIFGAGVVAALISISQFLRARRGRAADRGVAVIR
jgi:hypothetical protein